MNTRRFKMIVFGVCAFIILLVVYVVMTMPRALPTRQVDLPKDVSYAKYDDENIIFSNERFFLLYNPYTKQTKPLGDDLVLPSDIRNVSVSPDKKYVLFQTGGQYFYDVLGKKLTSQGLSTNQPTWWVYDISAKNFTNLDPFVIVARFTTENQIVSLLKVIDPDGNKQSQINYYSLGPLQIKKSLFSEVKYVDTFDQKGKLYGVSISQKLDSIDSNGRNTTVVERVNLVSPSPVENAAAYQLINNNVETMHMVNLGNQKVKKIPPPIEELSTIVWDEQGKNVYYPDVKDQLIRSDVSGKKTVVKLNDLPKSTTPEPFVILTSKSNTLLIRFGKNFVFTSNKIPANTFLPKGTYQVKLADSTIVEYLKETGVFSVSTQRIIDDSLKQEVYKQLAKDGINPDLVIIHFSQITSYGSRP